MSARLTGRSPRREDAIENALKAKLQARAAQRRAQEMMARQAAKELEEFTNEFKNAARHCFELIDVDKGGSLSKDEIVNAVHPKTGIEVANAASYNRANFNLRGLRDLRRNCCFRVFGVWWCWNNRTTASHFAPFAESHQVPQDVRRGEPAIFVAPAAAAEGLGDPGHG